MPSIGGYTWSAELDAIIRQEAQVAGVPLDLAYTFIAAESGFDPTVVAAEATGGYSYGLLQLYDHGQGAGYPPAVLLDPRRNLQIGLPYIAAAFAQTWSPTIPPFEFIYLVSIRSGHPGQVPRDDYRILRIARIWTSFFPAVGVSGPLGAPGTAESRPGPGISLTEAGVAVLLAPLALVGGAAVLVNSLLQMAEATSLTTIPQTLDPSRVIHNLDPTRQPWRLPTPWRIRLVAARRPPRHPPGRGR